MTGLKGVCYRVNQWVVRIELKRGGRLDVVWYSWVSV